MTECRGVRQPSVLLIQHRFAFRRSSPDAPSPMICFLAAKGLTNDSRSSTQQSHIPRPEVESCGLHLVGSYRVLNSLRTALSIVVISIKSLFLVKGWLDGSYHGEHCRREVADIPAKITCVCRVKSQSTSLRRETDLFIM